MWWIVRLDGWVGCLGMVNVHCELYITSGKGFSSNHHIHRSLFEPTLYRKARSNLNCTSVVDTTDAD